MEGSKCLGIVGGVGPETTAIFYLNIVKRFRDFCPISPGVIIDNVQLPFSVERSLINGEVNKNLLPFIQNSVKRLNKAEVDFIVIPCNTAHIFIKDIRAVSEKPVISIIDETASALKRKNIKKIGLLATSGTINSEIYTKGLAEHRISIIKPKKLEQDIVSDIVLKILNGTIKPNDKDKLIKIGESMLDEGAEIILLACTDLQSIIHKRRLATKNN